MIYNVRKNKPTSLRVRKTYIGETIEQKINRIVNNKEPIKDGAPILYTERAAGVLPETNIRTDRFEIALDETTNKAKAYRAKRPESLADQAKKNMEKESKSQTEKAATGKKDGGPESTPQSGPNEAK